MMAQGMICERAVFSVLSGEIERGEVSVSS